MKVRVEVASSVVVVVVVGVVSVVVVVEEVVVVVSFRCIGLKTFCCCDVSCHKIRRFFHSASNRQVHPLIMFESYLLGL